MRLFRQPTLGDWDDVFERITAALSKKVGEDAPSVNAEDLHLRGLLAFQSQRSDEAIACLREAVRLKPDFADAHNNLGARSWLSKAGSTKRSPLSKRSGSARATSRHL